MDSADAFYRQNAAGEKPLGSPKASSPSDAGKSVGTVSFCESASSGLLLKIEDFRTALWTAVRLGVVPPVINIMISLYNLHTW